MASMSPAQSLRLQDLPADVLQLIHLHALNPFFPQVNRDFYGLFHHASPTLAARYLLRLYAPYGSTEILVRALRHPVCTLEVAQEIKRIWDRRRGVKPPSPTRSERQKTPPETPRHSRPPLRCAELPRRIFKHDPPPGESPTIHPIVTYLFNNYSPSANSHGGYPLCRAVKLNNHALVSYLLERGADPALEASLAVKLAINMQDLKMVQLLVERPPSQRAPDMDADGEDKVAGGGRVKRRNKRQKLMDRVVIDGKLVEMAMRKGAKDIVEYFVHEKGVMPPLSSIMRLGDAGISPSKLKKARLLAF